MTSTEKVPPCPDDRQGGRLLAPPLRWQQTHDAQLLSRSYDVELLDANQAPSALPPQAAGMLIRWPDGSAPAYSLTAARALECDVAHRLPELVLGLLLGGEGAARAVWEPLDVDGVCVDAVLLWQVAA